MKITPYKDHSKTIYGSYTSQIDINEEDQIQIVANKKKDRDTYHKSILSAIRGLKKLPALNTKVDMLLNSIIATDPTRQDVIIKDLLKQIEDIKKLIS